MIPLFKPNSCLMGTLDAKEYKRRSRRCQEEDKRSGVQKSNYEKALHFILSSDCTKIVNLLRNVDGVIVCP